MVEKSIRILILGAGAMGGYYGARLLAAGRDVTFLVRPKRAEELKRQGIVIQSRSGDLKIPSPPTVTEDQIKEPFDLVFLSPKAYDLEGALESVAPAIGPDTAILPVLNGIRHLEIIETRFGPGHLLGGIGLISSVLEPDGRIIHLNELHTLAFGELDGSHSARAGQIIAALSNANFDARWSDNIRQEMWEKWVLIASGAGITCLMRSNVGDIVAAGGADLALQLLEECRSIAEANGYPPREPVLNLGRTTFTKAGSSFTASMFRDIERKARIEADQIIGDLLIYGGDPAKHPILRTAYAHLKTYETRRGREAAPKS